jgi:hypothetical protein
MANKISNQLWNYNCNVNLGMVKVVPEQLELLYRLCSSEPNHVYFTNHEICCRTFDMWVPTMPVLLAGDNHTTTQFEY